MPAIPQSDLCMIRRRFLLAGLFDIPFCRVRAFVRCHSVSWNSARDEAQGIPTHHHSVGDVGWRRSFRLLSARLAPGIAELCDGEGHRADKREVIR